MHLHVMFVLKKDDKNFISSNLLPLLYYKLLFIIIWHPSMLIVSSFTDQLFSPGKKTWPSRSKTRQHDCQGVPDRTGDGPTAVPAIP